MTRSVLGLLLLALWTGLFASACSDEEDCINCPPVVPDFVPQTSPEAVVANLVEAYRKRNIEEYSRLLAPEFIFKFQPVDVQHVGAEFWTRDQDTTGTDALFGTPLVSQITLVVTHGSATLTEEIGFPPGTMTIRLDTVQLEVDQTDGITWLVRDIQDMFFRAGNQDNGENPDFWFLLEWRDVPTRLASQGAPTGGGATWGFIKTMYQK